MDRPGVRQVQEGSGEQGKMEKTGLQNHLWCPNDHCGQGIDDDDDDGQCDTGVGCDCEACQSDTAVVCDCEAC